MRHIRVFLASVLVLASLSASAAKPDSVNVFFYHHGSAKDGLRVAYSIDGRTWLKVGDDYQFVRSDYGSWGGDKSMLSTPSLVYADGRWCAVWAVDGKFPQFASTWTKDLWVWKPQDYPYATAAGTVVKPVIDKEKSGYVVRFMNKEGQHFRVESKDFVRWTEAKAIAADEYNKAVRLESVTINGEKYTGEKHRIAYKDIDNLLIRVADARARGNLIGERMAQDGDRFKGMSGLKATLNVNMNDKKSISDRLIGIFFEDINYAADGGLYAELIQNRDFEYTNRDHWEWNSMTSWKAEGDALKVTIADNDPIHPNNSHYAVLEIAANEADGHADRSSKFGRLVNEGFDGIPVKKGEKYDFSIFVKAINGSNRLKVRLLSDGKTVAETSVSAASKAWKQQKAVLTAKETADKCVLSIEPQQAGTVGLDFISLFPQKTFKNRKNGLRADLAQVIADMKPRFVRFPGGCMSHGNGIDNMYHWQQTVGELWERKPDFNIWHYHQTRGLGFYEYFQFCEDIGAEPLPVLPAGVPCQNSSTEKGKGQMGGIPMEEMDAYTQELLDLIEWANGDAKTSKLAAMRAKAGHPKPFNLKMIGVGNEDIIGDVFAERFAYINKRIKAAYPNIEVVGTVGPFYEGADYEFGWQLAKREKVDIVDEHYYIDPGWYINNRDFYDKYDRNGTKVYLGEWASRARTLENALAEALHLTSVERNADVVVMASYAPLFGKNGHTQWNPDLIYFDNTSVKPTVNYHVQKLYGQNSGDEYIYGDMIVQSENAKEGNARQLSAARKRIAHSVVRDSKSGDIIVKLVNCTNLPTAVDVNLCLPDADQAEASYKAVVTTLTGAKPGDTGLSPTETAETLSNRFSRSLPPYSFTVIRLKSAATLSSSL